jgi:hypothetical protein
MLAPNPNPGIEETPPPRISVPVRAVPAPHGQVLERTDLPSDAAQAPIAAPGVQFREPRKRFQAVSTPSGAKVLEDMDAAPPPASAPIDPARLVERSDEAGQRILDLRDATPPPQRAGPQRIVVDIPADSAGAAMPVNPDPNVLYRVVKPEGGS